MIIYADVVDDASPPDDPVAPPAPDDPAAPVALAEVV